MIFGRTHKEESDAWQAHLKHLKENRVRKFAWRPIMHWSGRWIWMQSVWAKYSVWEKWGEYHLSDWGPIYYLTEKGEE